MLNVIDYINLENLLCPFCVKHLKIFLDNSDFFFLVRLVKILKNDCDIHIDHNHEIDNDKRHKIDDCYERVATVAVWQSSIIWITVRGCY